MTNAGNGARIKVWAGPNVGSGIVRNITYKNWIMSDVVLPLTIDQVRAESQADNKVLCSRVPVLF